MIPDTITRERKDAPCGDTSAQRNELVDATVASLSKTLNPKTLFKFTGPGFTWGLHLESFLSAPETASRRMAASIQILHSQPTDQPLCRRQFDYPIPVHLANAFSETCRKLRTSGSRSRSFARYASVISTALLSSVSKFSRVCRITETG
jgi:hypothetical protein